MEAKMAAQREERASGETQLQQDVDSYKSQHELLQKHLEDKDAMIQVNVIYIL